MNKSLLLAIGASLMLLWNQDTAWGRPPGRGGGGRGAAPPHASAARPHSAPPAARHTIPPPGHGVAHPPGPHKGPHPGPKPLTPAWYAQHPKAWYATHPYRRWPVITGAVVAGWVGLNGGTVVYQQDVYNMPADNTTTDDASAPNQSADNSQWLPLGMFGLVPPGAAEPVAVVQLAIDHQGIVAGSHHDVLSGTVMPLQGLLNKQTQKITWRVEGHEFASYQTDINGLTQEKSVLLVSLGEQEPKQWTLLRMENPTVDQNTN